MLLDNYKKQSPIVGVAGLGGGINSYIFLSGGADPYVISKSLRFNSADTSYLSKTFSSDGNRRTNTISFWIKKVKNDASGAFYRIFGSQQASHIYLYEDKIFWDISTTDNASAAGYRWTNRLFRDPSAWYHIVCALDTTQSTASNRMRLYVNGVEETSFQATTNMGQNDQTGFSQGGIEHTFGYRSSNQGSAGGALDAYLADVHFVDGQALAPTDFGSTDDNGVWQPKKYSGSHGTNGFHLDFKDNSSNAALGYDAAGSNNFTVNNLTAAVGTSTYGISFDGNDKVTFPGMALGTGDLTFECFFKMDSGTSGFRRILSRTDGGSGNDMIIRVHNNGYMQWYFDNQEHTGSTTVTAGVWHHSAIVRSGSTISYYYDGTRIGTDTSSANMTLNNVILAWGHSSEYFIGDIYGARITKQALYTGASYTVPTSAITTTSQGASSSNVVHLSATTSTTTTNSGTTGNGTDNSDPTAITAYPFGGDPVDVDSLLDSPSQSVADETDTGLGGQITGNYATLNPLSKSSQTNIVLANGNLEASNSSSSGQGRVHGTIAMSSGKWYFEATVTGSSSTHGIGIIKTTEALNYGIGLFAGGYAYIQPGTKFNNNSTPSYGASYTTGDTIGVAFDADNGTLIFYKNGASQGTAFTGLSGTFYPAVSTYSSAANFGWKVNFGQRAFSHAAPSGYKALTVENLSDPTIADGSKYFDTKLWTGDGASTRTISNYGFSPDFIWIKNRTTAGWQHVLYDQIRGAGTGSVTKSLSTDSTRTEASGNDTNHGYLSGFTSDGFNLVKGSQGGGDYVNHNSWDYVGWAWDAGTSTVTNNNGTITSQVRANQTAGFSICTYDGSGSNGTWGHGLLTAPDLVIVKCRNVAQNWAVQHSALGPTNYAYLQTTNAFSTSSGTAFWNNTAPTNTTVSVGTDNDTNSSGKTYVAYSFSTTPGYSSFGKYIGNGDADGIFIYTGFTPSWLLFKRSDSTSDWSIYDTTRDPHNVAGNKLEPNTTDAESSSATVDILSNGFKFRRNSLENGGNDVYVYAAFASKPFNSARAR
nr:hypothetical protein [uncultured Mediterranean phage uvMED]